MRAFEWVPLLQRQGINYVERGPNVKRGEINIRCPWCGSADPSQHLGLNLSTGFYSCWRHKQGHSGKSPVRLIMILLRCSYQAAREIAGLSDDYIDPEGFNALAARLLRGDLEAVPAPAKARLTFRPEFFDLIPGPRSDRFLDYLCSRGFDDRDLPALVTRYELKGCRVGEFSDRIVIPYRLDGELVTWTARAISGATIRYRDLSIEESVIAPKQTLFNLDAGKDGGKLLVLVEGPLDALKLDFYGRRFGVRAVAMSTNSITETQSFLIEEAATLFERVAVMMDNKTGLGAADSMRMRQNLAFIPDLQLLPVPANRGDAGELLPSEAKAWAINITKENP